MTAPNQPLPPPATLVFDTALGQFVFSVAINPDRRQFDVTFLEPWNGDKIMMPVDGEYTPDTRMQRVLKLLAALDYDQDDDGGINRNRELQGYAEGLLVGACSCFFTLCVNTAIVGTCADEDLDQYALDDLSKDETKDSFVAACKLLHKHLMSEVIWLKEGNVGRGNPGNGIVRCNLR